MLDNAGNKIIFWSKVVLYVGIALSVVAGFVLIWNGSQLHTVRYSFNYMGDVYRTGYAGGARAIAGGFLVMILGSLASWLTALLLRAFGNLTVDTRAIRERLEEAAAEAEVEVEIESKAPAAEEPAKKPAKPRTRKPAKPKPEETPEA